MPFSRKTIMRAVDALVTGNADMDGLELEFALNAPGYTVQDRVNSLTRLLIDDPNRVYAGENVAEALVRRAVEVLVLRARRANMRGLYEQEMDVRADPIWNALKRDGFTLDENEHLQPTMPPAINVPATDDEVHMLLDRFGFATSKGHLDEAVACHTRGNWAAANGQIRTFVESLLDEIAIRLDPTSAALATSENRRQRLAVLAPPFLQTDLNEWDGTGKNFTNGLLKRLHANGPHPGLSDEEDCTFRLHLVLLCGRLFLRRLQGFIQ